MTIHIDERSFQQTAEAVWMINPSARDRFADAEDLRCYMQGFAYQYGNDEETHSFGTGGFQLTFYNGADGERGVNATVTAYTVLSYLKASREKLDRLYEEMIK